MIPDSETVAAPSRMFSTNILYGRSALDSVNTCAAGESSLTTSASTSPLRIARRVSPASLSRACTSGTSADGVCIDCGHDGRGGWAASLSAASGALIVTARLRDHAGRVKL
jgi:hypothetical protein